MKPANQRQQEKPDGQGDILKRRPEKLLEPNLVQSNQNPVKLFGCHLPYRPNSHVGKTTPVQCRIIIHIKIPSCHQQQGNHKREEMPGAETENPFFFRQKKGLPDDPASYGQKAGSCRDFESDGQKEEKSR